MTDNLRSSDFAAIFPRYYKPGRACEPYTLTPEEARLPGLSPSMQLYCERRARINHRRHLCRELKERSAMLALMA